MFSRDGTTALVTRDGDSRIAVLTVDGNKVEYTKRDLSSALRPYQIDTTGNGDVAVVGNVGMGSGDADSISLIDMRAKPIRVATTMSRGANPGRPEDVARRRLCRGYRDERLQQAEDLAVLQRFRIAEDLSDQRHRARRR